MSLASVGLLSQVAQRLREVVDVDGDRLGGLDISETLVDEALDLSSIARLGGLGEKRPHRLDARIRRSRSAPGVLGDVGDVAVQSLVLAKPVALQPGDVSLQLRVRVLSV